jgi:hypothetical protein
MQILYFDFFPSDMTCIIYLVPLPDWLRSLTSNPLLLTAVGSNPDIDFEFFRMRNAIQLTERQGFYSGACSCLK